MTDWDEMVADMGAPMKRTELRVKTPKPNRACEICGLEFYARPYRIRKGLARFCSHACRSRGVPVPSGEAHYGWKGDEASTTRKRVRAQKRYQLGACELCGTQATDRHHKDGDTGNNVPANIQCLCRRCHMVVDGRLESFKRAARNYSKKAVKPPEECPGCGRVRKLHYHGRCHACDEKGRRAWARAVEDVGVCAFWHVEHGGPVCWGPLEGHHAVPKLTLKNSGQQLHIWDTANQVVLCRRHHELVTNCRLYVTREMLPEGLDAFAAELSLTWYMERFYDREDVA